MAEIILAAKRGLYHRVLAELREGAHVDARDNEEATPLYWAACGGHSEICRLLLGKGADANLAVQWGSTPLHAAADRGHTDCIKYLLRYGAEVNAQNNNGDTPLHLASFRGHKEVCVTLVTHGADHTILNNHGKTPHQEAQSAQHKDITKIFSERKSAYRALSYPLTVAAGHDVATTRQRLRASDSDDSLMRVKKLSLRKNLLASSLEKQVEKREKPGTKQFPAPLNQLSDKPTNSAYHHHHRPFSDPTPSLLGPLNIEDLSDPAKVNNIMSDETDFHRRQEESERDHYIGTIDSLQLKVALLTSQKEALEVQLREGGGSPSQELIRKELEQKLCHTTKELEKQQQERRASDARSRQLEMELFRLKQSQKEHLKRPSFGEVSVSIASTDTSVGTDSLISEYDRMSKKRQNLECSLTRSICSCLQKPYLCQDSSLQHVFALMQEGKAAIHILKKTTTQRLEMIRSSLNELKGELLLDEPGQHWTLEEDYKVMEGRPVDRELKQSEDGLISQICVRIFHENQTYIMKVLMNHNKSPRPSTHHSSTDSLGAEFSILQSLREVPHPNITRICHYFETQTSELRSLFDVTTFLDGTLSGQVVPVDRTAMVIFPDYCTTLDHLMSSCRVDDSGSSGLEQTSTEVFMLRLLLQLLKALSHLQDHGIAHRDINSKAVVLNWNLRLVLGEFGHARKLRNDEGQGIPFVEKSQISAGNPLAWSPELLQFSATGPPKSWQKVLTLLDVYESSDMYSSAAMLCRLFGKVLAEDDSLPGMTAKSLPQVSVQPPGFLSSEAQALFGRLLKDNPAERPTIKEATLRTGMLLYGPRRCAVDSAQDVDAWIQAQDIRMLATPPQLITRELEELAKRLDWELCHDYMHSVSTTELWQLCNDPLVG